ncbi:unnamed protein product, partial [Symbiodinium natans]
ETVPPERWCVTRKDLKFLRADVKRAIEENRILPPGNGLDDFLEDLQNGPNVYTVTAQYIKPVTARAGKMSWALMRNPGGLDCHLFISHAWQEGIFEFISKALASWPWRSRNAWCCMLANPQNLDIGALIQSPRSSPFAHALRASSQVLVVPNRHASIYTRLWCAYEGYLAQEQGKMVFVARPSTEPELLRAMLDMCFAAFLGTFLGCVMAAGPWSVALCLVLLHSAALLGLWSMAAESHAQKHCVNLVGQFLSCFAFFHWGPGVARGDATQMGSLLSGVPPKLMPLIPCWIQEIVHYSFTFFWLEARRSSSRFFMDLDRVTCICGVLEAQQLAKGYQGSIVYAKCAQPEDEANIRGEIGDRMQSVDACIEVLLLAGMSSPALRELALAGIDIEHAGRASVVLPVVYLFIMNILAVVIALHAPAQHDWHVIPEKCVFICSRLGMLVGIARSPPDHRAFVLHVMTKCAAIYNVAGAIGILWQVTLHPGGTLPRGPWRLFTFSWHAGELLLLFLGITGTARLPWGSYLLQFFFARSLGQLTAGRVSCSCQSGSETDSGELLSDDSAEASGES